MVRQFKVFAVSFLLACLFAFPAYAEFDTSDSVNLGLIESWTSNLNQAIYQPDGIWWHLNPSNSTGFAAKVLSQLSSQNSNLDTIISLLKGISNTLGAESTIYPYNNAIYSFDDRYFYSDGSSSSYPGFIGFTNTQYINFTSLPSAPLFGYLEPGDYTLLFNTSGPEIVQFGFGTNGMNNTSGYSQLTLSDFVDFGYVSGGNVRRYRCDFTVSDSNGLSFGFCTGVLSSKQSGYCSGYIFKRADATAILNDQIGSSVDSHGQQLDDGVNQIEDLENTAFESLDTSIGSLDFSGTALGQVVSGFTFIRAVFSAVYSSSPYISVLINLSCMLGVLALFLRVQPRFSRWEREHRDRSS